MSECVIYCRVSSEEQVHNLSLGTQEATCREYCARNGLIVDRVFIEKGESAKTADRTEFQAMLNHCRQNKHRIRFVVVYTINRFARNNEDHFAVAGYLRRLGIGLRSACEPIDESPAGKFVESMLAAVAALDNDMRKQNTITGMKAALRLGRWPFQPPLGYTKGKDAIGNPIIVTDAERAPLIKQAFELYATGLHTKQQVLKNVTDLGLRTRNGCKLSKQSFDHMLANPFYAGHVTVRRWGERQRGNFDPLISQETFDRVQAIMAGRRGTVTPYQRNHPDFPLRGLAACGVCGHVITASWAKGRTRKYPYYHCTKRCKGVNIRKEILERRFLDLLSKMQLQPQYAQLFTQIVMDVWKDKQTETEALTSARRRQADELDTRKQRLLDAYVYEKVIDRATFHQQMGKLETDIAAIRTEIQDAKQENLDIEAVLQFAQQVMVNAGKLWIESPLDQRQRLQKVLFPQGIEITPDGEIRTGASCPIFNILQPATAEQSQVAPHIVASWNQILMWLHQLNELRQAMKALPEAA